MTNDIPKQFTSQLNIKGRHRLWRKSFIAHETKKAYLISNNERTEGFWMPKSLFELEDLGCNTIVMRLGGKFTINIIKLNKGEQL